ncbi:transcriptional regulator [Streptomyces silvisoli]|uniref:Transcriptional regulator n=1 Tax=Streptomyces silvisoli TaxID=3034235 RepID=A0ABT5ZQS4_9ACTN|nr:transcriptional regulator [Streptomyces silvisoli]MDF3291909.1 transcriptional regulator [Streptomyces silvisoli]
MSETWSETRAITGSNERQRRLAALFADMTPGAAAIRIHFRNPSWTWLHPQARAYDAAGWLQPLTRTQAITAARWPLRARPNAALWGGGHEFALTSAALTCVDRRR